MGTLNVVKALSR